MSHTIDLLNEVLEFLEPYVDVSDGSYGEPRPNGAMSLTTAIEQEIERLKHSSESRPMINLLHRAHGQLVKLAEIIDATRPEAFDGWMSKPYEASNAAKELAAEIGSVSLKA